MLQIRRALLTVSDKTGIVQFGRVLHELGVEIISTGGTRKILQQASVPVTDITSVTGNPEAFEGRMKTLSFEVASALLFHRERHAGEAEALGIRPIDMVVCNLYPFDEARKRGADSDELMENIDIGGPTMIRAAAKNFRFVAVVTSASVYESLARELTENRGAVSPATRDRLMRAAFNHTADYDAMIAQTLDEEAGELSLRLAFSGGRRLRYGENSHQSGLLYRERGTALSLYDAPVLSGKEVSYNNMDDIYAAVDAVRGMARHGVAIVKHTNPCGLADSADPVEAFRLAWAGDPVSAFGSVIAFCRRVDRQTLEFLELNHESKRQRKFVEVIVAPEFGPDALDYLSNNPGLRAVRCDPADTVNRMELKYLAGALLLQDVDSFLMSGFEVVTDQVPAVEPEGDGLLEFGLHAVRCVRSNAIVIVRRTRSGAFQLIGMGAGQPNRVTSTQLAVQRARKNLAAEYEGIDDGLEDYVSHEMGKALLVSDAFLPFADNIEVCAEAGIANIVQPGGSVRDKSVIKACNRLGVGMAMTGLRHFKH